nr:hypothetical protein [Mycoplasmopsis bovis]
MVFTAVINTSVSTSSASLAMYILRRCWKTKSIVGVPPKWWKWKN